MSLNNLQEQRDRLWSVSISNVHMPWLDKAPRSRKVYNIFGKPVLDTQLARENTAYGCVIEYSHHLLQRTRDLLTTSFAFSAAITSWRTSDNSSSSWTRRWETRTIGPPQFPSIPKGIQNIRKISVTLTGLSNCKPTS